VSTAGSLKQQPNGTWSFVVNVVPGPDGVRRQARKRGFATKKDAQAALDEVRTSVRRASYVAPAKMTVDGYFKAWVKGLPATGMRTSSIESYRRNLMYVSDRLGYRRLEALSALDLDALYSELLASGRRQRKGEGLSPRTVRYVHAIVYRALGDAKKKKILAQNVAEDATPPSLKSTKTPEMKWWTPEELHSFLTFTADEALGPLFRLAAMTGMRRGEVCGLQWGAVDLERSRLEVRQQLGVVRGQPSGGLVFSERTKTDHGRRRIDLDMGTVAVLRTQRARQASERLLMGVGWKNPHDLVFTAADGSPLDPESVARLFSRRVARAGLKQIRFHDLRHSHAAHLIAAGEQPLLISKRLGHASAAFTMDRYGHLFEGAGRQAASAVAAMVDGTVTSS
jgi:integrase